MGNEEPLAFFLGFLLGGLMTLAVSSCTTTPNSKWQSEAIKHGAAQYSPVTGKFEWNDEAEK